MKYEEQRQKDINKYIFTFQIAFHFLLMILLVKFADHNNITDINSIDSFMSFLIILLMGIFAITMTGKLNYKNNQNDIVYEWIILLIYLSIIGYFFYAVEFVGARILLFVPVIIITIKYGKRISIMIAGIIAGIMFISDLFYYYFYKVISLETSLIIGGLLILISWLVGNLMEIEKTARERIIELAEKDGLTDLINHRTFHDILEKCVFISNEQRPVSLVMMDLDHFKIYNDSYGHQKGDEVLKGVADILKSTVNSEGIAARYGGEEFALILPGHDLKSAKKIAEKVKETVEQADFYGAKKMPNGKITLSQGIAAHPTSSKTKEDLIQAADDALYKAKFVSKEKISVYQSIFDVVDTDLDENEKGFVASVKVLLRVLNAKDRYTLGHSERVMELALKAAKEMKLSSIQIRNLKWAALFHDIGKIEIPREVLNKQGKLTKKEWEMMMMHPLGGADIGCANHYFHEVANIIKFHHENFDGTGYPSRIKDFNIPIEARILRVVDSYDAMVTKRSYKSEMSTQQALAEINNGTGSMYDKDIVDVMCRVIKREQAFLKAK